jgi:uncharacterized protein YeaO (DUF488 family)
MKAKLRLRTFRYGEPARRGDGLRIGTTRRPPRGRTKRDWHEYFDIWFPVVAPSVTLFERFKGSRTMSYPDFCAKYERELLSHADTRQALQLLAALALRMPISIGCYCENESHCHRSHLRKLIERAARDLVRLGSGPRRS